MDGSGWSVTVLAHNGTGLLPPGSIPIPPHRLHDVRPRPELPGRDLPVLVIASGNLHKVAEIGGMLSALELDVRSQPRDLEIEETGATYAENARLKAETVAVLTGQWSLADDSGVEVDALNGRPGIHSARYAPSDHERIHRLLMELGDSLYRGAAFVSAMALADPQGLIRAESEGICHGRILREPVGQGAGYDPIFHVPQAGTSYACMSEHLRSRLGSRGKAARAIAPRLRRLLGLEGGRSA